MNYNNINNEKLNFKNFILIYSLLFFTPVINFTLNNAFFFGINYFKILIIFVTCIFILVLFFIKVLNILKINLNYYLILFFFIIWNTQFYFRDIVHLFDISLDERKYILKLIIILFLLSVSGFVTVLCFKKKFGNLIKYFLIFSILIHVFNLFLSEGNFNGVKTEKIQNYFKMEEKKQIKNENKNNIYFFLMDEMTSFEKYKELGLDIGDHLDEFKKNNFEYIYNAKSSYNGTDYTIGSIMNMNYYTEGIYIKQKYFYSQLLFGKTKPTLLKVLNDLDYNFWFLDNQFKKCITDEFVKCIKISKGSLVNNQLYKLLYDEPITWFFYNSYISTLLWKYKYLKYKRLFKNTELDKFKIFINENQKIIDQKNNFFFIQNMGPHYPFRDKDCNLVKDPFNPNLENYISSSKCALKQIKEMINFLNKIDKDSHVIFQADHGWTVYFKKDKLELNIEGYKIFNMLKINNQCKLENYNGQNIGNVETIRLVMSCVVENKYKVGESKTYYVKDKKKKKGTKFYELIQN